MDKYKGYFEAGDALRSTDENLPDSSKARKYPFKKLMESEIVRDHKQRRIVDRNSLMVDPIIANERVVDTGWTSKFWQKEGVEDAKIRWVTKKKNMKPNNIQLTINKAISKPIKIDKAANMMTRMGWDGGPLGKTANGIVVPITPNTIYAANTTGFGQAEPVIVNIPKKRSRSFFTLNVLLTILQFVKNDSELELIFDSSLKNFERRKVHQIVDDIVNTYELHHVKPHDDQMKIELVKDIRKLNCYILNSQSEGKEETRCLCIYKAPQKYMYLVTHYDLRNQTYNKEIEQNSANEDSDNEAPNSDEYDDVTEEYMGPKKNDNIASTEAEVEIIEVDKNTETGIDLIEHTVNPGAFNENIEEKTEDASKVLEISEDSVDLNEFEDVTEEYMPVKEDIVTTKKTKKPVYILLQESLSKISESNEDSMHFNYGVHNTINKVDVENKNDNEKELNKNITANNRINVDLIKSDESNEGFKDSKDNLDLTENDVVMMEDSVVKSHSIATSIHDKVASQRELSTAETNEYSIASNVNTGESKKDNVSTNNKNEESSKCEVGERKFVERNEFPMDLNEHEEDTKEYMSLDEESKEFKTDDVKPTQTEVSMIGEHDIKATETNVVSMETNDFGEFPNESLVINMDNVKCEHDIGTDKDISMSDESKTLEANVCSMDSNDNNNETKENIVLQEIKINGKLAESSKTKCPIKSEVEKNKTIHLNECCMDPNDFEDITKEYMTVDEDVVDNKDKVRIISEDVPDGSKRAEHIKNVKEPNKGALISNECEDNKKYCIVSNEDTSENGERSVKRSGDTEINSINAETSQDSSIGQRMVLKAIRKTKTLQQNEAENNTNNKDPKGIVNQKKNSMLPDIALLDSKQEEELLRLLMKAVFIRKKGFLIKFQGELIFVSKKERKMLLKKHLQKPFEQVTTPTIYSNPSEKFKRVFMQSEGKGKVIDNQEKSKEDAPDTLTANEIRDLIYGYFEEFAKNDTYKEFRFLGAFNAVESKEINDFIQHFWMCLNDGDYMEDRIVSILNTSSCGFAIKEDLNGSAVIYKTSKDKILTI